MEINTKLISYLVIFHLAFHGVQIRANVFRALDSLFGHSQPVAQGIDLLLLEIHQLYVKPDARKQQHKILEFNFLHQC